MMMIIIIIIIILVENVGLRLAQNRPDQPRSRFPGSALPRAHSIWQYCHKPTSEQNNYHLTIYLIMQRLNIVVSSPASNFA